MSKTKFLAGTYGLIAFLALCFTWSHNLDYIRETGGISGFFEAGFVNPAAASLTLDLLFMDIAACLWMVFEARRLGMGHVWAYIVFGQIIAISVTFPLFLMVRQRRLAGG